VELVRRRPGAQQPRGGLAEVVGDVVQRAEGAGHAQGVADAPQDVTDVRIGGEQAGQRGLPDPRLAAEHDDRPRPGARLLPGPAEEAQLVLALEQLHLCHVT
jgi:hypothetical protein